MRAFIGFGNDYSEQEVDFGRYVVGIKGDFFDRVLRLNLTGFVTKFKQLEFGVFFPNPNVASGQETAQLNIGAATTKGIELEATLNPAEGFSVNLGMTYAINRRATLVTQLGVGLSPDAPDFSLTFKLPYAF